MCYKAWWGRRASCIDGINPTIYYYRISHSHMRLVTWLASTTNSNKDFTCFSESLLDTSHVFQHQSVSWYIESPADPAHASGFHTWWTYCIQGAPFPWDWFAAVSTRFPVLPMAGDTEFSNLTLGGNFAGFSYIACEICYFIICLIADVCVQGPLWWYSTLCECCLGCKKRWAESI